jgi:hypothetical protein
MKELLEYESIAEILTDAVNEKWARWTPAGRIACNVPKPPSRKRIVKFKDQILEKITACAESVTTFQSMTYGRLYAQLRADNYPDEFKIAIKELLYEQKIVENRLETGRPGRPSLHYYLYER